MDKPIDDDATMEWEQTLKAQFPHFYSVRVQRFEAREYGMYA